MYHSYDLRGNLAQTKTTTKCEACELKWGLFLGKEDWVCFPADKYPHLEEFVLKGGNPSNMAICKLYEDTESTIDANCLKVSSEELVQPFWGKQKNHHWSSCQLPGVFNQ